MSEYSDPTIEELEPGDAEGGFRPETDPGYEPEPYEPQSIVLHHMDGSTDLVTDQDGDGHADLVQHDADSDGNVDLSFVDSNADGRLDTILSDFDEDGLADQIIADTNFDGVPDQVTYLDPDTNPFVSR